MTEPQLPSFMKERTMPEDSPTNIDIAARARSGAEAVDALIKERNAAQDRAQNLARHYDVHKATIEGLERQVSMLDAKLTYYLNLSTSLITRLSSISMTVEDAMRESREAATRGESLHTSRPGIPSPSPRSGGAPDATPQDQKRLEDFAQRLAPETQELMELSK